MVASQVTIKIRLHPCLKFRNEDPATLSQGGSCLTRKVGNASTENITFTFEYELKSVRELLNMNLEKPLEEILGSELPFQMETNYTGLDGAKYTRVITMKLAVSQDRAHCEDQANAEILCQNAL